MNSTLPLLSLLPNGNYSGSTSLGDNNNFRSYDYVNSGEDNNGSNGGQTIDFGSYGYPDDLSFSVSHPSYQRPSSGHGQQNGGYPHLVQPDFSNQYRADHGHHGSHHGSHSHNEHHHAQHSHSQHQHHVMNDHRNGSMAVNGGDASRFLDLDLSQPGPSSYGHGANGLYSSSEASHEEANGYVDARREDELVKVETSKEGTAPAAEGEDADNEEPLYVNAKQYHRILKRRLARARLEELNRLVRSRKPYLHESRHRHACSRPRGKGGRFLTADEIEQLKREEAAKAEAGESTAPSTNGDVTDSVPNTAANSAAPSNAPSKAPSDAGDANSASGSNGNEASS